MRWGFYSTAQYDAQNAVKALLTHARDVWGLPTGPREQWPEGYQMVLRTVRALNDAYFPNSTASFYR